MTELSPQARKEISDAVKAGQARAKGITPQKTRFNNEFDGISGEKSYAFAIDLLRSLPPTYELACEWLQYRGLCASSLAPELTREKMPKKDGGFFWTTEDVRRARGDGPHPRDRASRLAKQSEPRKATKKPKTVARAPKTAENNPLLQIQDLLSKQADQIATLTAEVARLKNKLAAIKKMTE